MAVVEKAPARKAGGRSSKSRAAGVLGAASGSGSAAAVLLPLDLIEPGHFTNPRGDVDVKGPAFAELVASIDDVGLLQPIVVGPAIVGVGRHPIIAGWRRFAAAQKLGLTAIPVHQVQDVTEAKAALAAALAENAAREDVTPLAEARAIDTLMTEHGYTQVAAGKAIGMAERTVRERLRLLALHVAAPSVGAAIDSGEIPMDAATRLQSVAKASPALAEYLVSIFNDDELGFDLRSEGANLTSNDGLAAALSTAEYLLNEMPLDGRPAWLTPVGGRSTVTGASVPMSDDQLARWQAIPPELYHRAPPPFSFDEHIDAARKAGCLLEVTYKDYGREQTSSWIVDREFLLGLIDSELDRMVKAGEARAAQVAEAKAAAAGSSGQTGTQALSDEQRAQADAEKAKQIQARDLAHHRNVILGERSAHAFEALALSLDAAKLVALLALEREAADGMLARGVRYCDPEYLTEVRQKNGAVKRTYGRTELERLRDEVLAAESPEQAIAPVLRALALAAEADEEHVVAPSNRAYYYERYQHSSSGPRTKMKGLLAGLIAKSAITKDIAKAAKAAAAKPVAKAGI